MVLTGAEVDTIAGLLTLRERHAFALYGADRALAVLAANPIFGAVNPAIVPRRTLPLDQPLALADAAGAPLGLTVEAFAVPGKVPLFMEDASGADPGRAEEGETIGLRVSAGGRRCTSSPAAPPCRRRSPPGWRAPTASSSTARSGRTTRCCAPAPAPRPGRGWGI